MVRRHLKVVLDTNILISSIVFGGKPRQIVRQVLEKQVEGVTTTVLLAELFEVLSKRFSFEHEKIKILEKKMKKSFTLCQPTDILNLLKDEADNRVLEAAEKENCDYIITGDKELLSLSKFKGIKIVSAAQFLNIS